MHEYQASVVYSSLSPAMQYFGIGTYVFTHPIEEIN